MSNTEAQNKTVATKRKERFTPRVASFISLVAAVTSLASTTLIWADVFAEKEIVYAYAYDGSWTTYLAPVDPTLTTYCQAFVAAIGTFVVIGVVVLGLIAIVVLAVSFLQQVRAKDKDETDAPEQELSSSVPEVTTIDTDS